MSKIITVFHAAALLLALFSQTLQADEAVADGGAYKIQPGDVLEVSVWKEENLLKTVLVRPDGGISFPLAGNVVAAGKSVDELQSLITEQLTKYIPDPVVTVSTQQLSGNKVYVIGKVARPGEFLANRYMVVVLALCVGGVLSQFAAAF
jgi:polysaccharide export outer membrane protein